MSDLFDDSVPGQPAVGQNAPEFSVSEISGEIKRTLEGTFGRIRVRGEVGRVFKARSGHLYYDIKDDRSVLACTTWKGQISSLSVVPEEGLEVIVTGRLTAFGAQSKYNMNVDEVAVAGQGALMALLEKRKKQLEAEGLFALERKTPLPYLPQIIGVVTSPSGAVIRDILHRLRERFPRKVLVWPVAVQGPNCAPEVARAIEGFNRMTPGGALPRPDLIIVARGGGAIEDLWGFNEEVVARAAAASDIPLISAVGHETDTTLIDFTSDKRAPTPTAAAELAVPVRLDLMAWVEEQGARLMRGSSQAVQQRRQRLNDLSRAMPRPESLLDSPRQRFDRWSEKLPQALITGVQNRRVELGRKAAGLRPATLHSLVQRRRGMLETALAKLSPFPIAREVMRQKGDLEKLAIRLNAAQDLRIERQRQQLDAAGRQLDILSYKATLARGYAVVRSGEDIITTRVAAASAQALSIEFADGAFDLASSGAVSKGAGDTATPPAAKTADKPAREEKEGGQGSLF
ncbi:exodeoxyribonuclease VII large subunit [Pseudophaeobacter sp.]|uniref:exodeoxyribonuclease VII large subunit n=1 Tax=Pseudophaeobacter sp. TaxID=1971739 RepID=UPI0032974CC2